MNKSIIDELKENSDLQKEVILKSHELEPHEKLYCIQKGARFEVQKVNNRRINLMEENWELSRINYQFITSFPIKDEDELDLIVKMIIVRNK
jgi:hypothetical protein